MQPQLSLRQVEQRMENKKTFDFSNICQIQNLSDWQNELRVRTECLFYESFGQESQVKHTLPCKKLWLQNISWFRVR